ncbi:phage tail assembly protein [Helicobacter bizzozeronii]|uniref:Phage tail assembly protein n=1 Tax=Helicobacter bizzozeronii (strain CIII-1) TaxID=1002804 RepID=F8KPL5_HELBC|nr:phage tail assembly protein [Helicobacter bizzozeronii]CCB80739.1 hypothetical protein HBZC1_17530 [Helicobacter bizzozeronii CIII-1]
MPLKPLLLNKKTFTFRDGQSVELHEPTLFQLQKANKAGDDVAQIKSLLFDCTMGELDERFLNGLPLEEFERLAKLVSEFRGIDSKNLDRV